MKYKKTGSTITVELEIIKVGDCYTAIISGGEAPHIGCVVLAEPRPSLSDPEVMSCTSSVINRTGHKDESICRPVAEALCVHYNAPVVCLGGVHEDNIGSAQINEVLDLVDGLIGLVISNS